jgi:LPS sulfotransferase NodH
VIRQLFKQKKYTKFIVLTKPRTGSNLLVNSLQTHPEMKVFGELFRGGADEATKKAILASVDGYFSERVFRRYDKSIKAVGFKIFYHHPVYDHSGKVWDYLLNCKDLRVIHLRRENLLRALVSMKIAEKTDVWKVSQEQSESVDKRIQLSVQECLDVFCKTRQWENEANEKFANNPVMELTYEQLTSDYQRKMRDVQKFLGVKPADLHPLSSKQNPEALADLIVNYSDLEDHFAGTDWEIFFNEGKRTVS